VDLALFFFSRFSSSQPLRSFYSHWLRNQTPLKSLFLCATPLGWLLSPLPLPFFLAEADPLISPLWVEITATALAFFC